MCEGMRRDPMEALTEAVDLVVGFMTEAPSAALGQALSDCRRQQDRLEAAFTQGTGRFAANREFVAEGAPSAVSWLKTNCRLSGGAAAERLGIARQLNELPAASDAFARGDLGYQHMALIARTATQVGAAAIRDAQPMLLESAASLDPTRFSLVTRHLRNAIDPDGTLADANRAYDQRYVHLSQSLDGIFFLDGRLDPVNGATLQTALNALSKPIAGDTRSAEQRRADALCELSRRQLNGGTLPLVGGQRPHLMVKVSAATLAGAPGCEAGDLTWGGTIPVATVRRLACDAALTVIPLDDKGEPIDGGRVNRIVPPALRRALTARDGGCRFPGCDRPIDWTEAHHLTHWADGGETTLKNTALVCPFHHNLVHEGGWDIVRQDDGSFVAIRPGSRGHARRDPPSSRSA
ncbi:MAG TPA: DUF222 domain-containing protein [Candidatus Limnocylindrales bacterium]|nr:DUF222 domain-containing protein [Candidatus Limnocylindrales bacterium]